MSVDSLVFLITGGGLVLIGMAVGRFKRPIGGDIPNHNHNEQKDESAKMAHKCRMGCEQEFIGKVARNVHEENCNGGSEHPDPQDTSHTGEKLSPPTEGS